MNEKACFDEPLRSKAPNTVYDMYLEQTHSARKDVQFNHKDCVEHDDFPDDSDELHDDHMVHTDQE